MAVWTVEQPAHLTTPLKVANIRSTVSQLAMTPHSRAVVQESLDYLETKLVKYRMGSKNFGPVPKWSRGTQVKPRSPKTNKGPPDIRPGIHRARKARIAAAETQDTEKAAHREAVKLAKELKAQQAIEAAKEPQLRRGVAMGLVRVVGQGLLASGLLDGKSPILTMLICRD